MFLGGGARSCRGLGRLGAAGFGRSSRLRFGGLRRSVGPGFVGTVSLTVGGSAGGSTPGALTARGAAGSPPQSRPPSAMSTPAASKAARRPTFAHRTRCRRARMQAKGRPSAPSPRC